MLRGQYGLGRVGRRLLRRDFHLHTCVKLWPQLSTFLLLLWNNDRGNQAERHSAAYATRSKDMHLHCIELHARCRVLSVFVSVCQFVCLVTVSALCA